MSSSSSSAATAARPSTNPYDTLLPVARRNWPEIAKGNFLPEQKVTALCQKLIQSLGDAGEPEFITAEYLQELEARYLNQQIDKASLAVYNGVREALVGKNPPPALRGILTLTAIAARNWIRENESRLAQIAHLSLAPDRGFNDMANFIGGTQAYRDEFRMEHGITCFPEEIARFPNLTGLSLNMNRITSVPENLRELCPRLEVLDLTGNDIDSLSENIRWPAGLKSLDLTQNQFTTLPAQEQLPRSLGVLSVACNKIAELPQDYRNRAGTVAVHANPATL